MLTTYHKVKCCSFVLIFMEPMLQAAEALFTTCRGRHQRYHIDHLLPTKRILFSFNDFENILERNNWCWVELLRILLQRLTFCRFIISFFATISRAKSGISGYFPLTKKGWIWPFFSKSSGKMNISMSSYNGHLRRTFVRNMGSNWWVLKSICCSAVLLKMENRGKGNECPSSKAKPLWWFETIKSFHHSSFQGIWNCQNHLLAVVSDYCWSRFWDLGWEAKPGEST